MPVLETVAPRQQSVDRPKGTNKIEIPNATRPAEIVDVYIFNVTADKDRAYTTDVTGERNVRIKVRFDKRPDIILAKTYRLYVGKKAAFSQFLQLITGIEAGSEAMRKFNTDELLSDRYKYVLVSTEYKDPYTNIVAIMPRPTDDDDFGAAPPHTPREPDAAPINGRAIKDRLKVLLRSNLRESDVEDAIHAVTGKFTVSSITSPEIAARVVEKLELALHELESEIPF